MAASAVPAPRRTVLAVVTTGLAARLPQVMVSLSLILLVRDQGYSYGVVGLVTAGYILGSGLAAPFLGRAADALGPAPVLAASSVASGTALGLAAAAPGALGGPGLALVAVVAGAATPPISSVLRALLPRISDADGLRRLYALEAALQEMLFVSGPLIVVALVALSSPRLALGSCGALLAVGTAGFAVLARRHAAPPAGEGRRSPLRSAALRRVGAAYAGVGIAFGAIEVATIAALEDAGHRDLGGLVLAAWAAGSLGGGLVAARRTRRVPERRLPVLLAALTLLTLPLAPLSGVPPLLAAALLVQGVAIAPTLGTIYELVPRAVPAGALTEAFAWMTSAVYAGVALGNALAGALVEAAPWYGYLPAAAAPFLAALLWRPRPAAVPVPAA